MKMMTDEMTPGFDPERPKRKVRVVRRDISFENDVIPLPDAGWEDRDLKTFVKFLTPLVYMECGSYVVAAWDLVNDKPGILILNHSIFPQLRDWNRDFGQPVVDTTFMIDFWMQKGLVYHRITSMGQMPILGDERMAEAEAYINDLFGEAWVDDVSGLPITGSDDSEAETPDE
jgi:hypothetical protein